MRFRSLNKWANPNKCVGLVFFAQLCDEMLFDFSLDTYKPSVTHTGVLCAEALLTIKQVEAGNIKKPNIQHVISELCTNLEKDPVAKSLIPLPLGAALSSLKNTTSPLGEQRSVLELLAAQLSLKKYRQKNEEFLAREICEGSSVSEIRRLGRSYITNLLSMGFSHRYLQETIKNFFHYGKATIDSSAAIYDFFNLFPAEVAKFVLIFRVDPIFEHAGDTFEHIELKVAKTLPPDIDLKRFANFASEGDQQLYAIVSEVSARDIYSARANAENRLKMCATLLGLFHHKAHPSWAAECIVIRTTDKHSTKVASPINSMHKCADLVGPVARKRLQLFMNDFSLEKHSFATFMRSAQLHSMALGSNSDENQILNLWIALESLVPSESKGDDISNIEHIVNSLMPFLNIDYVQRLLNNLVKDLLRWDSKATRAALRSIPGKKFIDKIAKLIILPAYETERNALETAFREFHLLRDRFDFFKTLLSSPAKVAETLDAHKQRIEWQIRRIYRTRNIIVHSGQTPAFTRILIEHTHDYLDTVLASLVRFASTPKTINSVAQGFKLVELKYNTYYKNLTQKGLSFDANNIDELLFNR